MSNILCKWFGHSMRTKTSNIAGESYCKRKDCTHTSPAIVWPRCDSSTPMPKCKPPKVDIIIETTPMKQLNIFEHQLNTLYSQLSASHLNKQLTMGEVIAILQSSVRDAKLDILDKEYKRTKLPNQGAKRPTIKGRAVHNFVREKLEG